MGPARCTHRPQEDKVAISAIPTESEYDRCAPVVEAREIPASEIGRGYEVSTMQVIPVTDEELQQMPLPTARAIKIEAFVPLESIDAIQLDQGYHLQPDGQVAAKVYKLQRGEAIVLHSMLQTSQETNTKRGSL